MSEQWIIIPGWDKFQHYPDRDPLWIKNYRALLTDEDYLGLPEGTRAVLHGLWLAYASSDGQLRLDTRSLSSRLRLRVTKLQLERLNHAGWIEFAASKPLALARARARSQEETRQDPPKKVPKKNRRRVTGWRQVRGSHGITHIRDPKGTDQPPAGALRAGDYLGDMH
jgi:hypothetical protein